MEKNSVLRCQGGNLSGTRLARLIQEDYLSSALWQHTCPSQESKPAPHYNAQYNQTDNLTSAA